MAAEEARIGLDNPALYGRFRARPLLYRPAVVRRPPARPNRRSFDQQVWSRPADDHRPPEAAAPIPAWGQSVAAAQTGTAVEPSVAMNEIAATQTPAVPLPHATQRGIGNWRQWIRLPQRYSKLQLGLLGLAGFVFLLGLFVSLETLRTNHSASAQVAALSKKVNQQTTTGASQNSSVPSAAKPSAKAVSQYLVAPDLPRYLNIPKLGVHARVLQVGVTASGALGTPSDIYDTAWYTGSAKPGQPGATLIDGHVSSWTAHGVFYGLHTLAAGDRIQIVRGDGAVLNYQVVKTQVYNHNDVDMRAAMTPVTAGKSGLNLITCTGKVIKGTSEFNERVVVFAQQV